MIQTNANKSSVKEIMEREKREKEAELKAKCEVIASERAGDNSKLVAISNASRGLWYLPAITESGEVEKLLVLKPIDRNILSFATTKITDDGLYAFLEAAMRECVIKDLSDMDMLEDDEYFIPAANSFNKIMESKKTAMLKR